MSTNEFLLHRDDDVQISKTAVLQALFRVQIPVNARVALVRLEGPAYEPTGLKDTAVFLDPRRFVLWAVKEGYVPDEYRKVCLRYARG